MCAGWKQETLSDVLSTAGDSRLKSFTPHLGKKWCGYVLFKINLIASFSDFISCCPKPILRTKEK